MRCFTLDSAHLFGHVIYWLSPLTVATWRCQIMGKPRPWGGTGTKVSPMHFWISIFQPHPTPGCFDLLRQSLVLPWAFGLPNCCRVLSKTVCTVHEDILWYLCLKRSIFVSRTELAPLDPGALADIVGCMPLRTASAFLPAPFKFCFQATDHQVVHMSTQSNWPSLVPEHQR